MRDLVGLSDASSLSQNFRIDLIDDIIKTYGITTSPQNKESYPDNKIGWIESRILASKLKNGKIIEKKPMNLICSHWLLLIDMKKNKQSTYNNLNGDYGNSAIENGNVAQIISCKTCGLPIGEKERDGGNENPDALCVHKFDGWDTQRAVSDSRQRNITRRWD